MSALFNKTEESDIKFHNMEHHDFSSMMTNPGGNNPANQIKKLTNKLLDKEVSSKFLKTCRTGKQGGKKSRRSGINVRRAPSYQSTSRFTRQS